MRTIQDRLLWLESSLEYHTQYSYVERLQKQFKHESKPLWQDILLSGSFPNIKQLLTQISSLDEEYQIDIFNFISSDNIKFIDYIAENAGVDSLNLFFSLLKQLPKDSQLALFFNDSVNSYGDFFSKIAKNKSNKNAISLFLNYINHLPLLEKVKFLQPTEVNGVPFPLYIAESQRSLTDNGFSAFSGFFQQLIADFKVQAPNISLENIYNEVFQSKRNIKTFYELICKHQSSNRLFSFLHNESVPENHLKYFSKKREVVWLEILKLPKYDQYQILLDLKNKQGYWAGLYCEFKGPLFLIDQFKWSYKIHNHFEILRASCSSEPSVYNSYQLISNTITPVATPVYYSDMHSTEVVLPSAPELFEEIPLDDNKYVEQAVAKSNGFSCTS